LFGVPENALVQQCEKRWSSTFAVLERVVEQQQALCAVLLDIRAGLYVVYFLMELSGV